MADSNKLIDSNALVALLNKLKDPITNINQLVIGLGDMSFEGMPSITTDPADSDVEKALKVLTGLMKGVYDKLDEISTWINDFDSKLNE